MPLTRLALRARHPLPVSRLSDSHIWGPQCGPVFDLLEVMKTSAHHERARFAIVAVPSAEAADNPGDKGERAFRVRVFLAGSLALRAGPIPLPEQAGRQDRRHR